MLSEKYEPWGGRTEQNRTEQNRTVECVIIQRSRDESRNQEEAHTPTTVSSCSSFTRVLSCAYSLPAFFVPALPAATRSGEPGYGRFCGGYPSLAGNRPG